MKKTFRSFSANLEMSAARHSETGIEFFKTVFFDFFEFSLNQSDLKWMRIMFDLCIGNLSDDPVEMLETSDELGKWVFIGNYDEIEMRPEIERSDWLLKVTWLVLSKKTELFQSNVAMATLKFVYAIASRRHKYNTGIADTFVPTTY